MVIKSARERKRAQNMFVSRPPLSWVGWEDMGGSLTYLANEVFEDSYIAKGIKLPDKKARYVLNFRLACFLISSFYRYCKIAFCIIDETTTKQVKKQLGIYISW